MASKIIAIYGGRFHPFHKGHKAVYDSLAKKFGESNTFVCTSDKTGPGSPFTFKEKRAMMLLAGVPGSSIKQEVSPYRPENTLSGVSPDTAVIFAVGQKDMDENPRFKPGLKKDGTPTYYQPLKGKQVNDLEGYEKHGYLIVAPTVKFTVLGAPASSATQLRAQYKTLDDEQRKEFITDLFGSYNDVIQQVLDTRLAETTTERKLSGGEKRSKEANFKKLKKHKGDFEKRYGKDAEGVMHAVATKRAKGESVEEDTPYGMLKRKMAPVINRRGYRNAAARLHSVLLRKKEENGGIFRHALGWYASNIAGGFKDIDTKALIRFYIDNFDPVMTEGISPAAKRASRLRKKAAYLQKTMAKYGQASKMGMDPAKVNQRIDTPTLKKEEIVTPDSPNDEDGKLSGGVSPQMIAKQLPGVQDKQQLLQVLMKMKRGDTKYSRNQMIAAADAFKELISKDPEETQKVMMLLKKIKAESTYQFENINFDTVQENFADGKKKGKSRPGRVKRSGASCNGSVTELRAKAKKASGEKAKMYHWCANMKSGKKK
jgi:cytidyltransferase-like protein